MNSSVGGVGFLLSPAAINSLNHIEPILPRNLLIELEINPKTTIINAYSSHNTSPVNEVEEFYSILKSTGEQVSAHNFLVIAGEFTARFGPNDVNFSYNVNTNRNWEMLQDVMDEFNLFSANTSFMKRRGQLWTHKYPTGAQLDYSLWKEMEK